MSQGVWNVLPCSGRPRLAQPCGYCLARLVVKINGTRVDSLLPALNLVKTGSALS